MLTGFFSFLKLIFPFIRESFFGGGSALEWVKDNTLIVVLICFMVVMLGVMFYMIDVGFTLNRRVEYYRQQYVTLQKANEDLLREQKNLKENVELSHQMANSFSKANTILSKKLGVAEDSLVEFKRWFERCRGINRLPEHPPTHCYIGSPPRKHTRKPNHNKDVIERLKNWDINNKPK